MAQPAVTYTGDGSTVEYDITFPFLERGHVDVFVNSVPSLFSWVTNSRIKLLLTPGSGDKVWIKRTTPTEKLVDFTGGAALREKDLDLSYLQNLYILQELYGLYDGALSDGLKNLTDGTGIDFTTADEVINALSQRILEVDAADQLQQRITDIDLNAEAIIANALKVDETVASIATETQERIQADLAEATRVDTLVANLNTGISSNTSAIQTEAQARADAISAEALLRTQLATRVDDAETAMTTEIAARSNADGAILADLSLLGVKSGDGLSWHLDETKVQVLKEDGLTLESLGLRLSGFDTKLGDNTAAIANEVNARTTADTSLANSITQINTSLTDLGNDITANGSAISLIESDITTINGTLTSQASSITSLTSDVSGLTSDVSGNATAITGITTRVTDAEGSIVSQASSLTSLSSTVGDHTSTLTTYGNTLNGLEAEWGVRINNNGHVSGIQLLSGVSSSDFIVQADKFKVITSSGSGLKSPFVVSGSNIWLDGVIIEDGTISADALNVSSLSAISATMGTVTGGLFQTASSGSSSLRTAIGSSQYPIWVGTGSAILSNKSNAKFYVDNNGSAYFAGTLDVSSIQDHAFTSGKEYTSSDWTSFNTSGGEYILGGYYDVKQSLSSITVDNGGVVVDLSATMVNEVGLDGFLNIALQYRVNGGAWILAHLWEKVYWANGSFSRLNVPLALSHTFDKDDFAPGTYDFRFLARGDVSSFIVREPSMSVLTFQR